jgi:hypothetical protein
MSDSGPCSQTSRITSAACKLLLLPSNKRMAKALWTALLAFAVSVATAWINPETDERALYGSEGAIEHNWLPRAVAGWPAPFLADKPGTSVIHKVGVEDIFRPGPFVATLGFWFVVISAIQTSVALLVRVRRRWQRRSQAVPPQKKPRTAAPNSRVQASERPK